MTGAGAESRAMVPSRQRVDELGQRESMELVETAATAVATQARAIVEARYVMAVRRPRDLERVRTSILKACESPEFAQLAIYSKPQGGKNVEGLSIRFAEAAIQAMTNLAPEERVVYDDDEKRIVSVSLTDLESNVPYSRDITISKTVERRSSAGRKVLGERVNTDGGRVFIVMATDDELANKEAALCSKARRNHALALLPPAIKSAAMAKARETMKQAAKKVPHADRVKWIVDAFAERRVTVAMLSLYLGHPITQATPEEIDRLNEIGNAIADGETTWQAVMEERNEAAATTPKAPPDPSATPAPAAATMPPRGVPPKQDPATIPAEDKEKLEAAREGARRAAGEVKAEEWGFGDGKPPAAPTPAEPPKSEPEEPKPNSPADVGFTPPETPAAEDVDRIVGELKVVKNSAEPTIDAVRAFDKRIAKLTVSDTQFAVIAYFEATVAVIERGPYSNLDGAMHNVGWLKRQKFLNQDQVDLAKKVEAERRKAGK